MSLREALGKGSIDQADDGRDGGAAGEALALVSLSGPAAAASLAGKDGMIHACFKAKGKGKGTLRVVRSAKAKCPRGWKKTAWNAAGRRPPAAAANKARLAAMAKAGRRERRERTGRRGRKAPSAPSKNR